MTEHVLEYTPAERIQDNYYWCGPTSTHMVLSTGGVDMSQAQCATELGTTTDGTADINNVLTVLRNHLPQDDWQAVHISDPPSDAEREALWEHIVTSIDGGRGIVANIEVPPSNYPRGVKGSVTPSYGGGTVFHYIAPMGYDDDPAQRTVFIADPGFRPFSYWVTLDQLATMIPPKGYAWANSAVPQQQPVEEVMATNQEKLDAIYNKVTAYPDDPNIHGQWRSRSRYSPDDQGGVDDTVGMILNTDATVFDILTEFAASQGFEPARQLISARAKAHPEDERAAFFASKYPTKSS
jgi:hypothetical protein